MRELSKESINNEMKHVENDKAEYAINAYSYDVRVKLTMLNIQYEPSYAKTVDKSSRNLYTSDVRV
jgi:hypothetical protein